MGWPNSEGFVDRVLKLNRGVIRRNAENISCR